MTLKAKERIWALTPFGLAYFSRYLLGSLWIILLFSHMLSGAATPIR